MRDLTQIGENVFDTVVPSTESPIIDRPTTSIPLQSPTIPLVLNDISTQRPPYYRIPDTIGLQREATSSRVIHSTPFSDYLLSLQIEGDATLSIPPKEFVNSNEVAKNIFDNDQDLPFIGDSTTFEVQPILSILISNHLIVRFPQHLLNRIVISHGIRRVNFFLQLSLSLHLQSNESEDRNRKIWAPFTFSTTRSVVSSFRHNYFGTTEPSVDPPSLEKLQKGFERW